jgi:hypothetical protein
MSDSHADRPDTAEGIKRGDIEAIPYKSAVVFRKFSIVFPIVLHYGPSPMETYQADRSANCDSVS